MSTVIFLTNIPWWSLIQIPSPCCCWLSKIAASILNLRVSCCWLVDDDSGRWRAWSHSVRNCMLSTSFHNYSFLFLQMHHSITENFYSERPWSPFNSSNTRSFADLSLLINPLINGHIPAASDSSLTCSQPKKIYMKFILQIFMAITSVWTIYSFRLYL